MKIEKIGEFHFNIIINWRDHSERLVILILFLIGGIIGILANILVSQTILTYFILFTIIISITIVYYLLWQIRLSFNVEENSCLFIRRYFGMPIMQEKWKISDISTIKSVEKLNSKANVRDPKLKSKISYVSIFEISGFREAGQDTPTMNVYSHKTYNLTEHTHKVQEINIVAKGISDYFQQLGLPIDYQIEKTYF